MKNDITKLFNLTGVIVDKFKVDKEVLIYIRSPRTHCICPKCERTTKKIYDRKIRRVVHGIMNRRKIVLVVRIRRFRCRNCGNIFTEKILRKIFQEQNIKGYRRINRFLLLKNHENLNGKELQELDDVFVRYEKFPVLKQCYLLKERVRKMYTLTDYKKAEKELDLILLSIENYPVGKMREIHNTLSKWKPYILNYFYSRTTNAFIEGCHNKIKLIKRTSFGFRNFTNYMMKITLAFAPIMLEFIHTNT